MSRKKKWLLTGILIVLMLALYFTFIFTSKCVLFECFEARLKDCDRARILYDSVDTTWRYEIIREQDNKCEVEVELVQVKRGQLDIDKLQGLSMTCMMPLGVVDYPERNIANCHGLLKEGLQDIIIQRLHAYILGSLEDIGSELENVGQFVVDNSTNV